jgi:hypothetical protein
LFDMKFRETLRVVQRSATLGGSQDRICSLQYR